MPRSSTRISCSRPPTGTASPPSRPCPTEARSAASSSFRTSAASTASTKSWPCGSPNAGSPQSRSTTSGAPPGSGSATTTFPTWITSPRPTPETIQLDVAAAVAGLRGRGASSIFTVGFCFGGRNSWLAAAGGHGLRGAVGFYGSPVERNGRPGPLARAAELAAPILALQAGDDQNITAEQNAAFDKALTAAGIEHEVITYEGAPHSFFDRRYEEFARESEDAWRRVLDFIDTHA